MTSTAVRARALGIAYASTDKIVVRTGYGIFYTQAFYPGWGGGVDQTGFNAAAAPLAPRASAAWIRPSTGRTASRSTACRSLRSSIRLSLTARAAQLSADRRQPSVVRATVELHDRGAAPDERHGEPRLRGQQGHSPAVATAPINVLNPSLLGTYGSRLTDQFSAGHRRLAGVSAALLGLVRPDARYGCTPTVAQALLPYPQYCGSLTGLNENLGSSTYHAFQLKVEKRFSGGLYALLAYTHSKILTNAAGLTQSTSATWNGTTGSVISPFEKRRNKSLASRRRPEFVLRCGDVRASIRGREEVPQHWRVLQSRVRRMAVGLHQQILLRHSILVPVFDCGVPGQFQAACIPAVLTGQDPFASPGELRPRQGPTLVQRRGI